MASHHHLQRQDPLTTRKMPLLQPTHDTSALTTKPSSEASISKCGKNALKVIGGLVGCAVLLLVLFGVIILAYSPSPSSLALLIMLLKWRGEMAGFLENERGRWLGRACWAKR